MTELKLALVFLTRLPLGAEQTATPEQWGRAALWYPAVGLLIGLLIYALSWVLAGTPVLFAAAFILTGWVAITGALHLDGLADSLDAWVGGLGDKNKTLDIMKDPRAGPMAVVALVLLLLLKFAAIATLLKTAPSYLLWVPLFARTSLLWAMGALPYARPQGLGATITEHLPNQQAKRVILASLLLPLLWMPWTLWATSVLTLVLLGLIWRRAVGARLEGFTGDTLGALVELQEVVLLAVAVFMVTTFVIV